LAVRLFAVVTVAAAPKSANRSVSAEGVWYICKCLVVWSLVAITVRAVELDALPYQLETNVPVVPPVYHELKFDPAAMMAVSTARVTGAVVVFIYELASELASICAPQT
jgi:hypothetical protein